MTRWKALSLLLLAALVFALGGCGGDEAQSDTAKDGGDANPELNWPRDGSEDNPLIVMLVPADGGTEDGTKKDFVPVFTAITKSTGLHFDISVGQSYGAVVEAMANAKVDVAFFGAVSYLQCKEKGGAELLCVSVAKGDSVYYSGIFVRKNSPMKNLEDLKGHSLALGDPSSTSSFNYPVAMLLDAGIDPVNDLTKVRLAGSHSASLAALAEGKVDAAAASFTSLGKAEKEGFIPAGELKPLVKSEPIPNPPMAMQPGLPQSIKDKLREGFRNVHEAEGITPEMLRGYGGKKVDRYDVDYKESEFMKAAKKLGMVDPIKPDLLKKGAEQ